MYFFHAFRKGVNRPVPTYAEKTYYAGIPLPAFAVFLVPRTYVR